MNLLKFLGFAGKPRAVRKPAGHTITIGPYGERIEADTLKCCHCQHTWEVVAGSGRRRGFCTRCFDGKNPSRAVTCGSPACMVCVPWERRLENIEQGRPELTPTPPLILVPGSPVTPPIQPVLFACDVNYKIT